MMRAPSDTDIARAEQRLVESEREVAASIARLRLEFRGTLAKPAMLVGIACVAAVAGYTVERHFSRAPMPVERASAKTSASSAGIAFVFLARYGLQFLPQIASWLTKKGKPEQSSKASDPG